jgi:hypothetical protein
MLVDAEHARHLQAQELAVLEIVHVVVVARDRGVGTAAVLGQTPP